MRKHNIQGSKIAATEQQIDILATAVYVKDGVTRIGTILKM